MKSYHSSFKNAIGRGRTIQADDGTMPTLMARFRNDVVVAVNSAVK